tara:strand:+ start:483 stop:980 length:498 start_codon:yes stop_codon:yes gene_type:complete
MKKPKEKTKIKFLLGHSGTGLTSYALFLGLKETKNKKVLFIAGKDTKHSIRRKLNRVNRWEDLDLNLDNFALISITNCSDCNWDLRRVLKPIPWDYNQINNLVIIDPVFLFEYSAMDFLKSISFLKTDILLVSSENMFQKMGFECKYNFLQIPQKYKKNFLVEEE